MENTLTFLENMTRETHKQESEVISMAFQAGIKQLWREHILGQYRRGIMSRDEAVESAAIDWVKLAERQHKVTMEDVSWALKK
jgi:hypothetical protein